MYEKTPSEERIWKAIECKTPDRVPVALRLDYCAARWAGINAKDFTTDPQKASSAIEWAFDKIGGWDAVDSTWAQGLRFTRLETWKIPTSGLALPPDMLQTAPSMIAEDYDAAIEKGMYSLITLIRSRFGEQYDAESEEESVYRSFASIFEYWIEEKRAVPFRGGMTRLPVFQFAYSRGWSGFVEDISRRPEKVKMACDATLVDTVRMGEKQSRLVGSNIVFVPAGLASPAFMSKKMYDQYFFPYFKEACTQLVKDGFTPRLHLNQDWTPYLEHLLELPKRKCIAELESSTNLKKAKKVLDGHMCICGGVPAHLLTRGTPQKVKERCRRLIDELGPDGYILMNDDVVPTNARYENVKALVDTGKASPIR